LACWRYDAVRSRRGLSKSSPSPEKASAAKISSLQELVCLVPPLAGPNARFVPVLLSSPLLPSPLLPSLPSPPLRSRSRSPPPSAALPALALALAHAHGWHAVVGHRCLIRKQNCWVSATRGLRHQRFDRSTAANPAPALGKHQLEQSSTLERWLLRSNFACLGDLES